MNTSHHDGGAPDVFSKTAEARHVQFVEQNKRVADSWRNHQRQHQFGVGVNPTPREINSDNIIDTLRRVWPEVNDMKGLDGCSVSWDNAAFNLRKKRVTLYVFFDHMRPTRQEDWAEWEWLHYRINSWLEYHQTTWRFRFVPRGRRVLEVVK